MSVNADRQRRLLAVFEETMLQEPRAREAFVDRACGEDPELRSDVLHLLAVNQEMGSFLEHPTTLLRSTLADGEHFPGTDRFRVVRRLGAGGMGVVYEVDDNVRHENVALKTLARTSAADVYRLKREFRSLADVAHPNLVCLYELFVEDERCFFTMELVRGVSFVDYARDQSRDRLAIDRVIPAFRQLVEGVSALHRYGKLHRDIKPSNILVTPEGRVVILDFGLAAELRPHHAVVSGYVRGGTPAYMSPEEGSGATPSEASDWYGVGVTLYQALTGNLPFAGPIIDVLVQKRVTDPPAPAEVLPDVPADLSRVCMGLLHRNPAQRLSGHAALHLLGRDTPSPVSQTAPTAIRHTAFIGRDRQLHELNDACLSVLNGSAATVSIHGESGIGKSALVRRFLSQFDAHHDVVVVSGRCYENESVPFKALDGVVDDLSRYLGSVPGERVETLMPRDAAALTRVFPVLLQVDAIAHARWDHVPLNVDALTLRRRAFAALRELLGRLADRCLFVMWIDDLQWADADSVVLLEELLRLPNSPAMLALLCFRSEETAAKPFLQALVDRAGRDGWTAMSLEPMTEDEAFALIGDLVPADSRLTHDDRHRMTQEAGGSPFVLEQLARYASADGTPAHRAPTFARIFDSRLDALPPDARRFLETLAICGRPMPPDLICDACGVARERQSLVTMLRSSQFIRSSGSSERVETYHDRIREVVAAQIPAGTVRQIHALMVQALVARRSDDCEALFEHYRGAGDDEQAAIQAGLAAAKASAALAFDRAAFFYQQALRLTPASAHAGAWREGLAGALANAGRPAEAAEAYLDATAGAGRAEHVELQRRAAEQLLIGGHIDRGLDLLRGVLAEIGIHPARTRRAALLWLLWRRLTLRWRGLRFVSRPSHDIDPDALLRVDTCWSAVTGLALVDVIGASEFSARHLQLALDVGEPYRISRALAIESTARSADPVSRRLGARLLEQSKTLATSVGNPHAIAVSILADGFNATSVGEWKRALLSSEQALTMLRDHCIGRTWEMNMAQNLVIWALMYLGELGEVSRRVPALLADARSRGNLYLATELCTRSNYAWLAADQPDEGERETIQSIARWSHAGFHRQHYSAMLARVQTALYRNDPEAGWRLLDEQEPMFRRSFLTRVQIFRIESRFMRARCALALAARTANRHRLLSVVRNAARRIARERMRWSDPIALLLRAGVAHLEGRTPLAVRHLHDAADRFERADMKLYLAAARFRIGALQKDERGHDLYRQAEQWMAAQNIKNPASMFRVLSPGFSDER
jgi:serine/threonine protein kinase